MIAILAAHCLRKISEKLISVRLGETNVKTYIDCSEDDDDFCGPPAIDINVVDTKYHENYRRDSRNQHFDIALLRLAEDVVYSNFVNPICLPLDPVLWTKDYTDHTFVVAGLYPLSFSE